MNLQEMINYINSNSKTISLEDLEDHDIYLFKRLTYAISDYEAEQCALCFVIKDRGLETETVYIKGSFPSYLKPSGFKTQVETKIADIMRTQVETKIADIMSNNSLIENYKFVFVDESRKIAEVIGYIYDTESKKSTEKRFAVIDVNDVIQFRELV